MTNSEENAKKLLSFYHEKAKEPRGGKFFQVWHKSQRLGTYWGRHTSELRMFLNKNLEEKIVKEGFAIVPLS